MKTHVVLFVLISVIFLSCSSSKINDARREFINFCDLPSHVGDTVWVSAIYSGVEEYWGLNGQGCDDLNVQLDYSDGAALDREVDSLFSKVHEEYYKYKIELEVKGVFENKDKEYGHFGSNNGLFRAIEFGKVKLKSSALR